MSSESPYRLTQVAELYDKDRFSGKFGEWLEAREVALYRKLVKGEGSTLLDVGAGTGKLSIPFLLDGQKVTSLDRYPAMLEVAQRKSQAVGVQGRFVEGNAEALPFPDHSFDVVTSSRVLMHLTDWGKALDEWCRVSKRTVIFDYPRLTSAALGDTLIKRIKKFLGFGAYPYRVYLDYQIISRLKKNGFHVVFADNAFLLPFAFHRYLNHPQWTFRIENFFSAIGLMGIFGSPRILKATRTVEGRYEA
ncbi:MAG: Ubiquinone/menaquinone biosynthesis C-methyltransferase UbiE [Elusimicrobia bacterium]|nr:Ubiquinone/menaquinone biosynthesis C-methyltransferase UbiE [Elusimicrobiota bacterium]